MKKDPFFSEINPKVLSAEYAVRGVVPTKAFEIKEDLQKNPSNYPFDEVTFCNIGNPHQFHQKPITFNRQVISCVLNPELLQSELINSDVKKRAQLFLDKIISAGSYTHSLGIPIVRESVANFIHINDKVPKPHINDIFLTQGASQAVHLLLSMLISDDKDGIMIPIPQYPLYSASISLNGGTAVPYYLDEESGWQLSKDELMNSYKSALENGMKIRALVVINPGNPTGAIFNEETIRSIIKFAVDHKIVLIADEVYRENIYKQNATFHSFRQVLQKMDNYREDCELASLHSVSKGLLGECGLRGGYLYIHNFNEEVKKHLVKLKSINLCSNSVGQMMVELMCNPPLENVENATKDQYILERNNLFESLKTRAKLVTKYLNSMKNVHSQEVEGAMYAFPSVKFSNKVIEISNGQPDLFYCMEVLKNTGIVLVPGSGFKQKQGTYHFRITVLINPVQKLQKKLEELKIFNDSFHEKYE